MINVNNSKSLNIILPNTNKALNEVLQNVSAKELETLSVGKDISSVLDDILKNSSQNSSQDKQLLSLVKNNPTLKELGSIASASKDLLQTLKQDKEPLPLEKVLKSFLSDIKDISDKSLKTKVENSGVFLESKIKDLQTPKQNLTLLLNDLSKTLQESKLPNVKEINTQLKTLLSDDFFKDTNSSDLLGKTKVDLSLLTQTTKKVQTVLDKLSTAINSNVDKSISPKDVIFSKDTNSLMSELQKLAKPEQLSSQTQSKEMFNNDLKAVLLKTHDEISNSSNPNKQEILKQIDKLTLTIDYNQLVSHLSNATSLYLPYSWDAMQEGKLTIKQAKNSSFFTDIELTLKDYGELNIRLGMFDKNQLNINIKTQSGELKTLLQENMPQLRQQLFSVGIVAKDIRFIDESRTAYNETSKELALGFEVKA
jgi:hypothetical protein